MGAAASGPGRVAPRVAIRPARGRAASVQDVLLRPYRFPFNQPTSLSQVCLHLKQTLGVPVVLDIAALDRQDVDADDTVQLELDGVRLKTGLKLLLDQVGLTYQVVPDDNLLIVTDREGSEDPLDRIWTELRYAAPRPPRRAGCRGRAGRRPLRRGSGRPEGAQADDHRGEAGSTIRPRRARPRASRRSRRHPDRSPARPSPPAVREVVARPRHGSRSRAPAVRSETDPLLTSIFHCDGGA